MLVRGGLRWASSTREEIDELLGRPLVSVVSTVRPDGTPHMTPVWHLVDGDDVGLTVDNSSVKASQRAGEPGRGAERRDRRDSAAVAAGQRQGGAVRRSAWRR